MPGAVAPFPTPIDALSDHQVETALLGIAGHIAAAQCRFLQFPAEFDARKLWAVCDGVTSCAHRVSWKIGMNIRTADEHLRTARALRKLPVITQAFGAGELTSRPAPRNAHRPPPTPHPSRRTSSSGPANRNRGW
jgi:hypothetical protein